jgi:hypothetical protein
VHRDLRSLNNMAVFNEQGDTSVVRVTINQ